MAISMHTKDVVSASFAECFVTLDGRRYSMLMAKKFEGKANVSNKEVYRLGSLIVGHKPGPVTLSFSMTIYKCTDMFDQVLEEYLKTGRMPTFDIQVSNEDPATSVGRSTKIFTDCVLNGDVLLSMLNSEGELMEQPIEGYCDGFSSPERFTNPEYM